MTRPRKTVKKIRNMTLQWWIDEATKANEEVIKLKTHVCPPYIDYQRVIRWINENPRRPAILAFTEGPERQIAYAVEYQPLQCKHPDPEVKVVRWTFWLIPLLIGAILASILWYLWVQSDWKKLQPVKPVEDVLALTSINGKNISDWFEIATECQSDWKADQAEKKVLRHNLKECRAQLPEEK